MSFQVRVEQFCHLATSPAWQAWLYRWDAGLFEKFRARLQASRGCDQNRLVMQEVLQEIDARPGGATALLEFLRQHYPAMVLPASAPAAPVFTLGPPGLLTFPRRLILTGGDLPQRVREFLHDKLAGDYVVQGDQAFVEYLLPEDAAVQARLPPQAWKTAQWRTQQS